MQLLKRRWPWLIRNTEYGTVLYVKLSTLHVEPVPVRCCHVRVRYVGENPVSFIVRMELMRPLRILFPCVDRPVLSMVVVE